MLRRACKIRRRDWNPDKCYRRHIAHFASFLCRASGCISMVGWTGASQDAPVSCNTGSSNPVKFTTNEIGTSGGGITTRYRRLSYGYHPFP
ncbi:ash family protein [Escherichia coli]|uniref:ash family protein n=1 Tax=Escherichia coli TaxID=562 RepID=UPI003D9C7A24